MLIQIHETGRFLVVRARVPGLGKQDEIQVEFQSPVQMRSSPPINFSSQRILYVLTVAMVLPHF